MLLQVDRAFRVSDLCTFSIQPSYLCSVVTCASGHALGVGACRQCIMSKVGASGDSLVFARTNGLVFVSPTNHSYSGFGKIAANQKGL